ncbi:MAG TPA: hypothetical protein PK029_06625 [Bacteroidales bacterium]|nr:MAG: hypothetical protein BWY22_01867 [Bacteroidetes bacterium ADurb.Bin217]HOS84996.1 hypothetical protein [Bacteroidales bacterium]HPH16825.1 hypothetical protein [Bacteroidales bacterium]HPM13139.1 hypothetical protein [Bacteroidales bacterium]
MHNSLEYTCLCSSISIHRYSIESFNELDAQGLEEYIFTKTGTRISYTKLIDLHAQQTNTLTEHELHALAQSCGYIDWNAYIEHIQKPQVDGKPQIFKLFLYLAAFVLGIFCIVQMFRWFIL